MNDSIKASDIESMWEKFQDIRPLKAFYIYPRIWKELQLRPQEFREVMLLLSRLRYDKVLLIKPIEGSILGKLNLSKRGEK